MLDLGVEGLILAGTGFGGVHKAWLASLQQAEVKGVAVVRASRTGAGVVQGDAMDDGFIVCHQAPFLPLGHGLLCSSH